MNDTMSKGPPTGAFRGAGIAARVAGIFGALLVLVIGTMLLVWLHGWPLIGLQGASEVHLTKARHALELSADSRVTQIEMALLERRGDVRLLSENLLLEQALAAGEMPAGRPVAISSAAVRRQLLSLMTAYPEVYEHLTLVSASSGRVLAANDAALQGLPYADVALLQRLSTPGVVEHVETVGDPMASNGRSLVVARQVLERNDAGLPTGRVLGILVATVSIQSILGEFARVELRSLGHSGSVSLFDQQRQLLAAFRLVPVADARVLDRPPGGEGIEGSFVETGADGKALLAVYRLVRIGAEDGWSLVVRRESDEALSELSHRAWQLLWFGLLFSLACLLLVALAARHLTRPIRTLAKVAQRLADGDLGARVTPHPAAGGDEVSALAATFNAMAARIEAWHIALAREVEMRTRELQDEKRIAQRYLDVAGVMLLVLDPSGRIALINRKGCEVLGWPESELLGVDWFGRFLPPPLQEPRRELFRLLLTGDGELPARDETTIINASGEQRVIDWRNILLRADDGHLQGVLSSGEDITERKQIEKQLNEQQSQLEALVARRTADLTTALTAAKVADRAKDAFLANVSHELRTPLNAVIGLSELARRLGTDPRQRDYLDKIANAGKTLFNLINDLLDLSKIAAGRLSFASETFSLRDLVRRSNSVMSHKATEKGLELCERIDHEVPDVLVGDPLRVEQILLNLLSNAIKFTAAGRVAIGIGVGQREAQRVCLDIVVEDTGVGISEEDLGRLFEPFSQADATMSRRFGGSGLGLAICRHLVTLMDGEISVSSRPGAGSTFRATIWLQLGNAGNLTANTAPSDDEPLPSAYRDARVLVVEDQPINREIVEALLAEVGITPSFAADGKMALDLLYSRGAQAFDLVLMDIQMPVMDGLTATRELRAHGEFRDLPIIAMTAHTMEHEKEISSLAGMSDHIGKPFETRAFYRLLTQWLPAAKRQSPAAVAPATSAAACPPSPAARGRVDDNAWPATLDFPADEPATSTDRKS
jgi:PAS domain S-box-containing protein